MYTHPTNMQRKSSLGIFAKHSSNEGKTHEKDERKKHLFKLQRKAQKLLPQERIAQCMRRPLPALDYVTGWVNTELETAGFNGLITCDSYSCPVCANKRAERDRRELSVALAQATAKGYFPVMLTFTVSHLVRDALSATKKALAGAFDAVFSGGWALDFKSEWGIVGKIKAWEFTSGTHGWNPHIHVLMFLEYQLNPSQIANFGNLIAERYMKALKKRGFHADRAHGLDVRTAESDIADYIAKFGKEPASKTWGADSEMARSQNKKSSHDGLTPFEILAAANGDKEPLERLMRARGMDDTDKAQKLAERLYIEFFNAMKRTPRIVWSDGLRKLLEIEEKLNSVQAAEQEIYEKSIMVVKIPVGEAWQKVVGGYATPDLRGDLLEVIRSDDRIRIRNFLESNKIEYTML